MDNGSSSSEVQKRLRLDIYTDGGVYKSNPSEFGAYAVKYVGYFGDEQVLSYKETELVFPEDTGESLITNNQTEVLAICQAVIHCDKFVTTMFLNAAGFKESANGGFVNPEFSTDNGFWKASEADIDVTIHSDSQIALGWVFDGYSQKKLPNGVRKHLVLAVHLAALYRYKRVLLAGHPTRAQLADGYKHKGAVKYPVSIHNVECDAECRSAMYEYAKEKGLPW